MTRASICRRAALAVLLAGPVLALAQPPRPDGPPAAPPVPWANKMFVAADAKGPAADTVSVTHDFGPVPRGTLLVHTFTVTNIYDVPLQVIDVRWSGDGVVKVDPPQRVLYPHDQAPFTVTMDTGRFSGPGVGVVYATVGPTFTSAAVLRLVATSRQDVALDSPGAINFDTVPAGTAATRKLTLRYSGKQPDWAVVEAVPPAGPVDVTVKPDGRGKFLITAALRPDAPPGAIAETILLKTNDPAGPTIPIPVRGTVRPPVQATPERVVVRNVRVGEPVKASIKIVGNTGVAFAVDPVPDLGDGVSVETLGTPNPYHSVTLRFTPTVPGLFRKRVPIRTTLNGGATVEIEFEATVEPALPAVPTPGK